MNELEKKLYQLIISRLNGDEIHNEAYREKITGLVKKGIGGFIIFGGRRDEIRDFINELQSAAGIPLFIASDIERGVQQQIMDTTPFSCPMAVAAAIDKKKLKDIALLEDALKAVAVEAIDVGINMPLIPVMDVNRNPDNPIICTRAFSDSPDEVSWFGSEYIKALEGHGLLSCAKHFPGHGDTSVDSHISLPVIAKSKADLMKADLAPFVEAIKAGVSSIMVGHLTVPAIDSMPASLSKKIITGLLRKELGFDGLVLTDALNMNALNDMGNVAVECLNAGADILLHPSDTAATVQGLVTAVESKKIDESRVDVSIERIIKAKAKLRNIRKTEADYRRHRMLSSQIVDRSVTLVKESAGVLPIRDEDRVHLIFAGDTKFHGPSRLRNYLKKVSVIADVTTIKEETALFAIFTSVAAWKGSSGIDETEREKIIGLIKDAGRSIVVSFGSPYVLRYFNKADILIAAYEGTEQAQLSVIKCLKGEMDFKGRLPVKFD